jgi:uncharacterized protein
MPTFPHTFEGFEIIETHISWVLLTGLFAYKIKKPVNLGFQDFTTLEKRKYFCEKEVELNRRLAPELYLGMVPITGTLDRPSFKASGEIIDYAVKMHQFSQDNLLNQLVKRNELSLSMMEALATQLAHFHDAAEQCDSSLPYGSPDDLILPMQDNFSAINTLPARLTHEPLLDSIKHSIETLYQTLIPLLEKRKAHGWIRACHGDLHLGNMVMVNNVPIIFDCIEFNERFRWIDVINDVAFLTMDLDHVSQTALGHYFINRYVELTNDYEGVLLLRFYQCYRAMVRAKVSAFQLQMDITETQRHALKHDFERFLQLAKHYTSVTTPSLTITVGLSGSGKTYESQQLLMKTGAIRLRSDILRRRLFGQSHDRYSASATQTVYETLVTSAEKLLEANYSVIIDAACLKKWQRERFLSLANRLQVPFKILLLEAPLDELRQRIQNRQKEGRDPSEATVEFLELQNKEQEPLSEQEKGFVCHST